MKNFKLDIFLDFLIEFFYLGIIFLIPVYFGVFSASAHPFDFQKMTLFKMLLFFLLFFSFVKFIFYNNFKKLFFKIFNKYFYTAFFVLIFSFITILWSVNPHLSFYGSLERQAGWLNEFYLFLFFIVLTLNLVIAKNKSNKIKNLLITSVLSSFVVSFYAVCQFLGWDFVVWDEPVKETGRAISTLGQPNFLGSFLLMTIPFSLCLAIGSKRLYLKIVYIFFFIIQLLAIIFSGSRGAWVGLIVASFLILILFYYKKSKSLFFGGIAIIVIALLFLIFSNNFISHRFKESFNFSSGSTSVRSYIWSASLNVLDERDWGYGLENQKDALWRYYQINWAVDSKVNVVFDRAHNLALDIVLSIGLIGLFFYLWFYYFVFRLAINNIREDKNIIISLAVFWSLVAYLVSLFFNFSVVATSLYFWMIISLLVALNFVSTPYVKEEYSKKQLLFKRLLVLLILILCSFGFWREVKNFNADYYFLKFKQFFFLKEVPASVLTFSYLRNESPFYQEYYHQFVNIIFNNFNNFTDKASRYLAEEEVAIVFLELEKDTKNKSFSYRLARAQALAILGNFIDSEKIFKDLQWEAPNYPDFYFQKAKMDLMRGDLVLAQTNLETTLSLLPSEESLDSSINLKALELYKKSVFSEMRLINGVTKD